jgi:hypothetical protein
MQGATELQNILQTVQQLWPTGGFIFLAAWFALLLRLKTIKFWGVELRFRDDK